MSKLHVVTVCGFGIGSSLILKMTLDSVLSAAGINDSQVESEPHDVTSFSGANPDLVMVSNELLPQVEGRVSCPLLVIENFLSEEEVAQKALPVIRALLDAR